VGWTWWQWSYGRRRPSGLEVQEKHGAIQGYIYWRTKGNVDSEEMAFTSDHTQQDDHTE
jgi:hypothetical protein